MKIFNDTHQTLRLEFFNGVNEEPYCVVSLLSKKGIEDAPDDCDYLKVEQQ